MKNLISFYQILIWICAMAISMSACKEPVYPDLDVPDPNRSGVNDIISFGIDLTQFSEYKAGDEVKATIVAEEDSVFVLMPWYVGTLIRPDIQVSLNATVSPVSGSIRDISQGALIYTVRSENGEKKAWKVFVKLAQEPEPSRDSNPRRPLESDNPKYPLVKINLQGNAYNNGTGTSRADQYIQNAANPSTDVSFHSIYFIVRHVGELQMALRGLAGNAIGGTINVKAFINGDPAKKEDGISDYDHDYHFNKTNANDTLILHRIIIPDVIPEGHIGHQVKLEIRCKGARPGSFYYRFYELWVSGWATRGDSGTNSTGVNYALNTPRDGRAAPSIHMDMAAPSGNMEYFYTEVTIPAGHDPLYSYYMTSGNNLGYAGIQTNSPTDRRFLFSIWSPAAENDPTALKAKYNPKLVRVNNQSQYRPNITYQVFGGEGIGGQSRINANWITGNTYKVLIRIRPHPDQVRFPNSTLIKGWFHNGAEWIFMCEWRRQEIQPGDKGVSVASGPFWYRNASHFVEDFNGQMGFAPRMAYYSNHWFITDKGEFVEPSGYTFTGNQAYGRADVAGGVITEGDFYNSIFLRSGGYFTDIKEFPKPFTKPAPAVKPNLDLEALNAMGTDDPSEDTAITPGEKYIEGEVPEPTGVRLSNDHLTLYTNEMTTLSAHLVPVYAKNPGITWISTAPEVATVNEAGLVTGVGIGEASIYALVKGTNFLATCKVTVTAVHGWWYTIQSLEGNWEYPGGNYPRYFRRDGNDFTWLTTNSYGTPAQNNTEWVITSNGNRGYRVRIKPETEVDGVFQCDIEPTGAWATGVTNNESTYNDNTKEFHLKFNWESTIEGRRAINERVFNRRVNR